MRKLFLFSIASLLTLQLVACSNRRDSDGEDLAKGKAEDSVIIAETGETAQEFYNHFLFHRVSNCPMPWYRYAGTEEFLVGQDGKGRIFNGKLDLVLKADGKYTAHYRELSTSILVGGPPDDYLRVEFERNWSVEGPEIVFENLGRGAPLVVNGRRRIELLVERDLIRFGLKGSKVQIQAFTTDDAPIDGLDNCSPPTTAFQ